MADAELSMEFALKNNLTPNGKEITFEPIRGKHLYRIKFVGGGELPDHLSGVYTSVPEVQSAIRCHLKARWEEHLARVEKKNAKAA